MHPLWDRGQCVPQQALFLQSVVDLPGDPVCSSSLLHPSLVSEQVGAGACSSVRAASEPLALVFGSERSGLSNQDLARCRAVIHIPTQRQSPSMNLGQAVAVVLYEMRRIGWEPPEPQPLSRALELEPLIETLAELGTDTDYPHGFTPEARLGRIRRALHEAVLPPATVRFLLSFSRWLRKKTTP